MRSATTHIPATNAAELQIVATVTLTYGDRHRRRIRLVDDAGEPFLLDLPQATYMDDGDCLRVSGASAIRVIAASEEVMDVEAASRRDLLRIAWHVGNRHMPVQVLGGTSLRLKYDHVLEEMVQGLGGQTSRLSAPFSPERGAYSAGGHGHSHHG